MALQAAYKQFLAAPNSSALAPDASLHYITTTTSIEGNLLLLLDLVAQSIQVLDDVGCALYAVEGQNAIALEADTTFEFVSSGGPFLPGLDDNFLSDKTVVLAIVSSPGACLWIRG